MNFLNPSGFWLLGLLIPVLLLYLLKLRREDHPVSSTYLWQPLVRDLQANAPWQRLQRNLLLFLQLLFLLSLIFAIARPFTWSRGFSSSALILIFDTSASMSAADVAPNRLEAAKKMALEILDTLPDETLITVISAGDRPRTLLSLSRDESLVRQTIAQLEPAAGGGDLASAVQIASAIAERQSDPQTIVFSDGWASVPDRLPLSGSFRFERVGSSASNQALQSLTYQMDPIDGTLTVFLLVANYSPEPANRRVVVYADGIPFHAADVEIPALSETPLVVGGILSSTEQIEARLLPDRAGQDYLALDDAAYAAAHQDEPARVALVGPGNHFLETALRLMPALDLQVLPPEQSPDPDSDLVIYDRTLPDPASYPQTNLLFISPPESTSFFTVTGQIDLPIPQIGDPVDPLVQQLDLSGVSILDAVRVEAPAWAKPVIVDGASSQPRPALLLTGEQNGQRVAVISFSLNRSDLPLQVAFPVLISRLVSWLAPGRGGLLPHSIQAGTALNLSGLLSSAASLPESLTILRPDGSAADLDPNQEQVSYADTHLLGVYQIAMNGLPAARFAVNFSAPSESAIAPGELPESLQAASEAQSGGDGMSRREGWRWAAGLALLLLLFEWLVYQRSALFKLSSQLTHPRHRSGSRSQ